MLRSCKDSCSWQQDERCRAKQHVIGFIFYARRPMVCIPLTPHHRAARRRWAAEHRDWEQHDWNQVLFTDESQFSPRVTPDVFLYGGTGALEKSRIRS
ncbi:hypothetical protein TNCV_4661251 [Trichonephila clavipes]|uniref:Transposase Tc1-like domain-containing protein n=1 Tax=Trichonephila clavipes TaxID=2585209 RepID=A0A8X6VIF5_TRICX|nr:hypothetical protein TNCV_4661251 [Trichonephila clavipes]